MAVKRVFISFDYDHDEELRNGLVGQSKYPNSPFDIADWSVKEPLPGNWKQKVRSRIRRVDVVAVICGQHTHVATGVAEEIAIAREEGKPYFLLKGRRDRICTKPKTALSNDKILDWTWDNLRKQIEGKTFIESTNDWLSTPEPWLIAGICLAMWLWDRQNREQRL